MLREFITEPLVGPKFPSAILVERPDDELLGAILAHGKKHAVGIADGTKALKSGLDAIRNTPTGLNDIRKALVYEVTFVDAVMRRSPARIGIMAPFLPATLLVPHLLAAVAGLVDAPGVRALLVQRLSRETDLLTSVFAAAFLPGDVFQGYLDAALCHYRKQDHEHVLCLSFPIERLAAFAIGASLGRSASNLAFIQDLVGDLSPPLRRRFLKQIDRQNECFGDAIQAADAVATKIAEIHLGTNIPRRAMRLLGIAPRRPFSEAENQIMSVFERTNWARTHPMFRAREMFRAQATQVWGVSRDNGFKASDIPALTSVRQLWALLARLRWERTDVRYFTQEMDYHYGKAARESVELRLFIEDLARLGKLPAEAFAPHTVVKPIATVDPENELRESLKTAYSIEFHRQRSEFGYRSIEAASNAGDGWAHSYVVARRHAPSEQSWYGELCRAKVSLNGFAVQKLISLGLGGLFKWAKWRITPALVAYDHYRPRPLHAQEFMRRPRRVGMAA